MIAETPLSPMNKLAAGRLVACNKMPYFRTVIMSLIPRETPGLGTFGVTERHVLLWDPAVVERWTVEEIAGVMLHEIGHVLKDHTKRARMLGIDPRVLHDPATDDQAALDVMEKAHHWNCAGDAEINDDLRAAHIKLPGAAPGSDPGDGPIYPDHPLIKMADGRFAEEYYAAIRQNKQQGGGKKQGQGKGKGKGAQQGDGQGSGKTPGPGWCGSGAGRKLPNEPTEAQEPGRTEADVVRIRQDAARSIQEHATKNRGNVPGGWQRWADEQLRPSKIPWRQHLARAARRAMADLAGMTDYRYARPSRRNLGMGVGAGKPVFPIMRAPSPRIVFALDTSGSMGGDDLKDAMSEADAVLKAVGAQVDFMSCDAMIHATGKVRRWQDAVKLVKGGGGTDFRPVFDAVAHRPDRPDVIIFATDGCGPAPAEAPPGIKVIWLLIGQYAQEPCTWGTMIRVERTEQAA